MTDKQRKTVTFVTGDTMEYDRVEKLTAYSFWLKREAQYYTFYRDPFGLIGTSERDRITPESLAELDKEQNDRTKGQ